MGFTLRDTQETTGAETQEIPEGEPDTALIFSHELQIFVRVGAALEEFIKIPEEGVTFSA